MRSWRSPRWSIGALGVFALALLWVWGCGRERVNPIDPNFAGSEVVGPPANLKAAGDIGGVLLTWNAVTLSNLAGYGVWRSTSSTGDYIRLRGESSDSLVTTARTTFADTTIDLKVSRVYFYKVNTVDALGRSSEFSTFVSAEALEDTRPPNSPSGLSAVTDDVTGKVALSWTAPLTDVNNRPLTGLTEYKVYRAKDSPDAFRQIGTIPAGQTTFADSSALEVDARYYYRVSAVDGSGNVSGPSGSVSISTAGVGGVTAPGGLRTVEGAGQITVSWNPVTDPNLIGYLVLRSASTQEDFLPVTSDTLITTAQTEYIDTGIQPDRVYFYRVQAVVQDPERGVIRSLQSTFVDGTASAGSSVPMPGGLRADGTVGQVVVRWNAVDDLNLIGYLVLRSASTQEAFLPVTSDTLFTTAQTEYIDTDVMAGQVYFYRVQAVVRDPDKGILRSIESPFVDGEADIDQSPPAAPGDLILSLDEIDVKTVNLSWSAPLKDSNGEDMSGQIARYQIYRSEGSSNSFVPLAEVPGTQMSYRDQETKLLIRYFYSVSAIDDADNVGPRSAVQSITTGGLAIPTGLRAAADIKRVDLAWSANTEPGLIGYKVLRADRSTGPFSSLAGEESEAFTTAQTAYVDSPLVAQQTFFYRLIAVGRNGIESDTSTFVTATVLKDERPPAAPTDVILTVDETKLLQVNLSWTPPTTDSNGGVLTGLFEFQIFRSEETSSSFVLLKRVPASDEPAYQDTTVKAVTRYFYTISAVDEAGNVGPRSTAVSITTRGLSAPKGVSATADVKQITVRWSANSESELTGYKVLRYTSSTQTDADKTFLTLQTSYVDSPLAAGETYVYRVQAVGTGGLESDLSLFASAQVPSDTRAPDTPGVFSGAALTSGTSIELSWSAPRTDEGGKELSGLSGYRIYRTTGTGSSGFTIIALVSDPSTLSYRDDNLELVTTYSYKISAIDASGNESSLSSAITLTTSSTQTISPPTGVQAVVVEGDTLKVQVRWTPPSQYTSFAVERQIAGSASTETFETIARDLTEAVYFDVSVARGNTYIYQVRTKLGDTDFSEPSNVAVVVVPTQ